MFPHTVFAAAMTYNGTWYPKLPFLGVQTSRLRTWRCKRKWRHVCNIALVTWRIKTLKHVKYADPLDSQDWETDQKYKEKMARARWIIEELKIPNDVYALKIKFISAISVDNNVIWGPFKKKMWDLVSRWMKANFKSCYHCWCHSSWWYHALEYLTATSYDGNYIMVTYCRVAHFPQTLAASVPWWHLNLFHLFLSCFNCWSLRLFYVLTIRREIQLRGRERLQEAPAQQRLIDSPPAGHGQRMNDESSFWSNSSRDTPKITAVMDWKVGPEPSTLHNTVVGSTNIFQQFLTHQDVCWSSRDSFCPTGGNPTNG